MVREMAVRTRRLSSPKSTAMFLEVMWSFQHSISTLPIVLIPYLYLYHSASSLERLETVHHAALPIDHNYQYYKSHIFRRFYWELKPRYCKLIQRLSREILWMQINKRIASSACENVYIYIYFFSNGSKFLLPFTIYIYEYIFVRRLDCFFFKISYCVAYRYVSM